MNLHHTPENSILGQSTDYPKIYSPHILFPISRELGRKSLHLSSHQLNMGVDYWHCFELSWLNQQGVSQVAMARMIIPANSPYIVESKSLKLYLNSLNFTQFDNQQRLIETIENDLSICVQANVKVEIFSLDNMNGLFIESPTGICIDDVLADEHIAICDDVSLDLLYDDQYRADETVTQCYYSHLLRSNCPVTNQPDWGTVQINMVAGQINSKCLLAYLLSYRHHNGFHEQCVEQIFSDLTQVYQPISLMVRAWYTRRGGIDINPVRVSDLALMPTFSRLVRQ